MGVQPEHINLARNSPHNGLSEGLPPAPAQLKLWLSRERPDREALKQIEHLRSARDVLQIAVMPDVHAGPKVCNGVALATTHLIYPEAIGGDIGCGYTSARFEAGVDFLRDARHAATVLRWLYDAVPFLKHSSASRRETIPNLDCDQLSGSSLVKTARRDGLYQLGTLGRGNHFIELQSDQEGRLWVLIHSGSRGIGQAITAFHLARAEGSSAGLAFLDAESPQGKAYLADMQWALEYASANRAAILERVAGLLLKRFDAPLAQSEVIDTHHNFLRREILQGRALLIHRKSVNSAADGEYNVIPGSMGSPTYLVEGRGREDALASCSHGAGRVMSRTEARRRVRVKELDQLADHVWFDHRQRERMVDEAPSVYRDIRMVMQAQTDLVKQRGMLEPILNYKCPGESR